MLTECLFRGYPWLEDPGATPAGPQPQSSKKQFVVHGLEEDKQL